MNPILYTKPSITSLEISLAMDAVKFGWGDKCNDYVTLFEKNFAKYIGTRYAVATSSCTGALTLGLAALGIGRGDEVIMADSNWIATAAPVVHLGAQPVFVDILPDTWCIDQNKIGEVITKRTKAILATHLYGNTCDMASILIGCVKYLIINSEISIIEDAAEALGSVYCEKKAGSIGNFGVFSFHGTKTMTTGEGGMIVTNDKDLYEKVLALSNHGRVKGQEKQFWPEMIGYKFKMSNVQAAIGCAQLSRIDELVNRKRQIMNRYKEAFSRHLEISMNPEPEGTINGSWMPVILFSKESGITRELLMERFQKANISARVFFYPLSSLPMFNNNPLHSLRMNNMVNNPVAYDIPTRSINLPSYHDMTDEDQQRVIDVVLGVL
jgi:perosamine synthetase